MDYEKSSIDVEWRDHKQMNWVFKKRAKENNRSRNTLVAQHFSADDVENVRTFHQSFQEYEATPLRRLSHLAEHLGVGDIFVKDESYRFGLNAFKALGGTYAMGRYLVERLGHDIREVTF